MKLKSKGIYVVVNRSGKMVMFSDEPRKNTDTGKWESNRPYVNSIVRKDFESMIKKANITWESEPIFFEAQIQNTNEV